MKESTKSYLMYVLSIILIFYAGGFSLVSFYFENSNNYNNLTLELIWMILLVVGVTTNLNCLRNKKEKKK